MDEDYILVPKDEVTNLKKEIKKLKEQLGNNSIKQKVAIKEDVTQSNKVFSEQLNQLDSKQSLKVDFETILLKIRETITDEMNKERGLIIENLSELKEINKTTLNNLLTKSSSLELQLEEMVDSIGHLVENLLKVTNKIPNITTLKKDIVDINTRRNLVDNQIIQKLQEIEIFLNKLKILLSSIKPNDLTLQR